MLGRLRGSDSCAQECSVWRGRVEFVFRGWLLVFVLYYCEMEMVRLKQEGQNFKAVLTKAWIGAGGVSYSDPKTLQAAFNQSRPRSPESRNCS